jgi:hypothetical protein
MKKMLLVAMVACLPILVVGCGGSDESCLKSAIEEYGSENVQQLNKYSYVVKEGDKYFYIHKMNLSNPDTTRKQRICLD